MRGAADVPIWLKLPVVKVRLPSLMPMKSPVPVVTVAETSGAEPPRKFAGPAKFWATMVLSRVNIPFGTMMPPPMLWAAFPATVVSRIVVVGPSAWMPPPTLAELSAKVLFWTNSVPWPFSSP